KPAPSPHGSRSMRQTIAATMRTSALPKAPVYQSGSAYRRARSALLRRQHGQKRGDRGDGDQHDDHQLEQLEAPARGAARELLVDAVEHAQLALDGRIPLREMKAVGGHAIEPREVLIAEQ